MTSVNRLSGLDACFLYLETSAQPLHVFAVMELDTTTIPGGYSFEALVNALAQRIRAVPLLRQRLSGRFLNLGHPAWVEDPGFDATRHVRRLGVPAPGGAAELAPVCAHLATLPIDRSGPLWELWVLEGVEGAPATERVTVVLKMHHSAADAVTYTEVLSQLCSDVPGPTPPALVVDDGETRPLRIAAGGFAQWAYRPMRLAVSVLPETTRALRDARRRAARGEAMASPFSAPPTLLNTPFSARRIVALVTLDRADVMSVTDAYGVRVNDVMAAVVGGAVRADLLARDALPAESLVAMTPVSVHSPEGTARNQLSGMLVRLHTQIAEPVDRLRAVAAANAVAKEQVASNPATLVDDWLGLGGRVVSALGGRGFARLTRSRPMYSIVLSNAPSPRRTDYLLGARVLSFHPFGPLLVGAGLNVTYSTLGSHVHVGLISSPDVLPDLRGIAESLTVELRQLVEAAVAVNPVSAQAVVRQEDTP